LVAEKASPASAAESAHGFVQSSDEELRLLGFKSWSDAAKQGSASGSVPTCFDDWGGQDQTEGSSDGHGRLMPDSDAPDSSEPRKLRMVISDAETPAVRYFRGSGTEGNRLAGVLGIEDEELEVPSVARVPDSLRAVAAVELNEPKLEQDPETADKNANVLADASLASSDSSSRTSETVQQASSELPKGAQIEIPAAFKNLSPIAQPATANSASNDLDEPRVP